MVEIVLCDNSPRLIWQKSQLDPTSQYDLTSMDIYHLPRPTGDTPLDANKAVHLVWVLWPLLAPPPLCL